MKSFALEIRSPEKAFLLERVISLSVPASDGSLGVLADHAPLAARLAAGQIVYSFQEGEQASTPCAGGFLIVRNNQAAILLDS